MEAPVEVAILGQASALPGPVKALEGDLAHLGPARLLPPSVRGSDRLLQRLVREARSRQRDDGHAPLYLASRSAADAGSAEDLQVGGSVAGLRCARAALAAVADGERPMVAGIGLLDPTATPVEGAPLSEAGGAAWLAPARDPAPGPRRRAFVACTDPFPDVETQQRFCSDLLGFAEVDDADIGEIISASVDAGPLTLEAALSAWLPQAELMQLVWRIGDAGPALGMLAFLAALEDEAGALVLATDRKRSCVAVVV